LREIIFYEIVASGIRPPTNLRSPESVKIDEKIVSSLLIEKRALG